MFDRKLTVKALTIEIACLLALALAIGIGSAPANADTARCGFYTQDGTLALGVPSENSAKSCQSELSSRVMGLSLPLEVCSGANKDLHGIFASGGKLYRISESNSNTALKRQALYTPRQTQNVESCSSPLCGTNYSTRTVETSPAFCGLGN